MKINWTMLGIGPTADKKEIKAAYRSRLVHTNPEDKPEEFMQLREAYEAALQYASHLNQAGLLHQAAPEPAEEPSASAGSIEQSGELHPVSLWIAEVRKLYYENFTARINPENWKALLADPVCTRIDTTRDACEALLDFLLEAYNLPAEIFRLMDQTFHFQSRRTELLEDYDSSFLKYILFRAIDEPETWFDYSLFGEIDPELDYEEFLDLYDQLVMICSGYDPDGEDASNTLEEIDALLEEIKDTGIIHPWVTLERIKIRLKTETPDSLREAEELMKSLLPEYARCATVNAVNGELQLTLGNYDASLAAFQTVLEIAPAMRWGRVGLAETYLCLEDSDSLSPLVETLLEEDPYSRRIQFLAEQADILQLTCLLEKHRTHTLDDSGRLHLSTLLLRTSGEPFFADSSDPLTMALNLLQSFTMPSAGPEATRYHNLGTALVFAGNLEAALDAFHQAETLLNQVIETASDADLKNGETKNLLATISMKARVLEQMGRRTDALQLLQSTAQQYPEEHGLLCRIAELQLALRMYTEAADTAGAAILPDDTDHTPYLLRAQASLHLGLYSEAYEDCQRCIEIHDSLSDPWLLKIRILIEAEEFDDAMEVIHQLEKDGCRGTALHFLRGYLNEMSGHTGKALHSYKKVLELAEADDYDESLAWNLDDLSETCLRLYYIHLARHEDGGGLEEWNTAVDYLRKGYEINPDHPDIVQELAEELCKDADKDKNNYLKAQELYERLPQLMPLSPWSYILLAENEIFLNRFDDALAHLEEARQLDDTIAVAWQLRGQMAMHQDRLEESIGHFQTAQRLQKESEEELEDLPRNMSVAYCRLGRYDDAIACLEQSFSQSHEEKDLCSILEIMRMQGRFEELYARGETYVEEFSPDHGFLVLCEMKFSAMFQGDGPRFERYNQMAEATYLSFYQAGMYLMYHGELKRAYKSFEIAAKAVPQFFRLHLYLGRLAHLLGRPDDAAKHARTALSLLPENFQVCGHDGAQQTIHKAEALAVLGQLDEAEALCHQSLETRQCDRCRVHGCLDAYCTLLYIACIRGDEAAADEALQKGLEICPTDYDLKHMKEVFLKDGQPRKKLFKFF